MYGALARLLQDLTMPTRRPEVLEWAAPVPFFGRIRQSVVATVGINPSNREFVDAEGCALGGAHRRLPSLESLSISRWADATGAHVREVVNSCESYFDRNPYRLWFDVLERMLNVGGNSYYSAGRACHLDLVAFATRTKWGSLEREAQRVLIAQGRRSMAEMIRDSPVQVLVLNGRAVVNVFERFSDINLSACQIPEWTLPRSVNKGVAGIAYTGSISAIAGIDLDRRVDVFGYNHNLQSSFGVTARVARAIGERVGDAVASSNSAR